MKQFSVLLFINFLGYLLAQKSVNYGNTLIKWERRELVCESSANGKVPGSCVLFRRNETEPLKTQCSFDKGKERHYCGIDCLGADRDSVISKSPNSNHRCIRFYSYDSHLDEKTKDWSLWRSGKCLLEKISLEIHCGFP
uniref:Secreted protein n=1 Tax=Panagrolaimus sp. JU765 TaxID=591449 RepID=A0AC34QK79_9BILA